MEIDIMYKLQFLRNELKVNVLGRHEVNSPGLELF